jgi:hypothetical protein
MDLDCLPVFFSTQKFISSYEHTHTGFAHEGERKRSSSMGRSTIFRCRKVNKASTRIYLKKSENEAGLLMN